MGKVREEAAPTLPWQLRPKKNLTKTGEIETCWTFNLKPGDAPISAAEIAQLPPDRIDTIFNFLVESNLTKPVPAPYNPQFTTPTTATQPVSPRAPLLHSPEDVVQPGDTPISAAEIAQLPPEETDTILNFRAANNKTKSAPYNPQFTSTTAAQPISSRSPLLQHTYTLGYSTEDVVKYELTGDNIDPPGFCCIPCSLL